MKYKISFGTSDFREIVGNHNFFVDKSLFIKELLEENIKVILIPRPRRFGKSLNFSMLKYFFDIKEESRELFKGLKISKEKECMEHMNKYPVLDITLKDSSGDSWKETQDVLKLKIGKIYERFRESVWECLSENQREFYAEIEGRKADISYLQESLLSLIEYLNKRYNKKVIVLIDEYDAVITDMYGKEGFEECINFFKRFYGNALKGNKFIHKALMTGIMRVAKEGIFSGLNNVMVCGVTDREFGSRFGFLEEEIKDVMIESNLNYEEVKNYYNGYNFGGNLVYNPWSVVNCLKRGRYDSYWKNTSGNDLIKELVKKGGPEVKYSFERMLEGESVNLEVEDNVNLRELTEGDIYSLLLQSGYLTYEEEDGVRKYKLPNKEVRDFISSLVQEITNKIEDKGLEEYVLLKDWLEFENSLEASIARGISFYDISSKEEIRESFYHALLLGIFVNFTNYRIKSNRESGMGRPDLILTRNEGKESIVIEIKSGPRDGDATKQLERAKRQIKLKSYGEELEGEVIKIGIGFSGKKMKLEVVE